MVQYHYIFYNSIELVRLSRYKNFHIILVLTTNLAVRLMTAVVRIKIRRHTISYLIQLHGKSSGFLRTLFLLSLFLFHFNGRLKRDNCTVIEGNIEIVSV